MKTPLVKALAWALFHFLWEGAVIAALLGIVLLVLRPRTAAARYTLAYAALAAMPAAFVITLAVCFPERVSPAAILPAGFGTPGGGAAVLLPMSANRWSWLPQIVPFWMAGVLLFSLRGIGGCWAASRLRRKGGFPAPDDWQDRVRAIAERLGVAKAVVLLESLVAEAPLVMGMWRPVILMPAGILTGLSTQQVEAILIHELAHIRRHDYLANLLQRMVEGLLFYHPAVWWVSGLVRAERENCCDDVVVSEQGDARAYALTLTALEQKRRPGEAVLAASGGSLLRRVRRLLRQSEGPAVASRALLAVSLIPLLVVSLAAWQPSQEQQQSASGNFDRRLERVFRFTGPDYRLSASDQRGSDLAYTISPAASPAEASVSVGADQIATIAVRAPTGTQTYDYYGRITSDRRPVLSFKETVKPQATFRKRVGPLDSGSYNLYLIVKDAGNQPVFQTRVDFSVK